MQQPWLSVKAVVVATVHAQCTIPADQKGGDISRNAFCINKTVPQTKKTPHEFEGDATTMHP